MINRRYLPIIFFALSFLGSCLTKGNIRKDPCHGLKKYSNLQGKSRDELLKLVKLIKGNFATDNSQDGCRAALLGRIHYLLDQMTEASNYFSTAAQRMPEIREYFLLVKAKAEAKRKHYEEAKRISQSLLQSQSSFPTPLIEIRLKKVLADIAVYERDDRQIIRTHEFLIKNGYGENEAILFNLAMALNRMGEHIKANKIFKKLLIIFPLSSSSKQIEKLRALSEYGLTVDELEKRFDKLIQNLAFSQVVKEADDILHDEKNHLSTTQTSYVEKFATRSLMLNNQFEAGLARSRNAATKPNATAIDLENYAWALAKAERFIKAAKYYGKFQRVAKDKEDKARGCFFKGFSFYEANLYGRALFAWQGCHNLIKSSTHYESYLWYQALTSLLNKDYEKALAFLKKLITSFATSAENNKYHYFAGLSLSRLGNISDSKKLLNNLAQNAEVSYYSLLARNSLKLESPVAKELSYDALTRMALLVRGDEVNNALLLFNLGLKEEAKDLILKSFLPLKDKAALLSSMGFYHDVWRLSHLLLPRAVIDGKMLKTNTAMRASHPSPYKDLVLQVSRKYRVNENLLYAIIRNESGFAKDATSSRGAIGLMQMMPFVAVDLASRLAIDQFDKEHLKDPKTAIELGALLVAILKKQFSAPHLVTAAYNAGPHHVQKWLNRFGHLPKELFIERIPFKQTRDYVKKVLTSESLYFAMNGNKIRLAF